MVEKVEGEKNKKKTRKRDRKTESRGKAWQEQLYYIRKHRTVGWRIGLGRRGSHRFLLTVMMARRTCRSFICLVLLNRFVDLSGNSCSPSTTQISIGLKQIEDEKERGRRRLEHKQKVFQSMECFSQKKVQRHFHPDNPSFTYSQLSLTIFNFIRLAKDVERIYTTIVNREHGGSRDPEDIDSEVKALAGERVKIEFLARLLFLLHLLDNNSALQPQQFFREQTTEGALSIEHLVRKLKEYDHSRIEALLSQVQSKIQRVLLPRRLGVVIALDEAQLAATGILAGKLISSSARIKNKNVLFDNKNQVQPEFRRGFLSPLSATLSNMQATLVILGTALSLQDVDHVYSAIAQQTNSSKITDCPRFDEDDGE